MIQYIKDTNRKQKDLVRIFAVLFLIFAIFSHTIGENENSRIDTTAAIVEEKTFSIDSFHNNTEDKIRINNSYYSDKPPLSALAAVPSYFIVDHYFDRPLRDDPYLSNYYRSFDPKIEWARLGATLTVSSLSGGLTAVLIYLILLETKVRRKYSVVLSILAGLGTLIFPYSTTFHGTMLATMLLIFGTYWWTRQDNRSIADNLIISFSLGLSIAADYLTIIPAGVLIAVMIIYSDKAKRLEESFYLFSGLFIGVSPLLMQNFILTDNPFKPLIFYTDIVASSDAPSHVQKLFSLEYLVPLTVSRFFRLFFDPLYGLFLYSPLAVFGVYGLKYTYTEQRKIFWYTGLSFLLSVSAVSLINFIEIRAYFGPRYLLPSTTLLIIPLGILIENSSEKLRQSIWGVGAISTTIMLSSTQNWKGIELFHLKIAKYRAKMLEFRSFENHLAEYLGSFTSEALQSPVLSYITGASSKFHMVNTAYPQNQFPITSLFNKIIIYDLRILSIALITVTTSIFFYKDIKIIRGFNVKRGLLCLIFLLLLGASSTSYFMHDWYPQETHENHTWGREDPAILIQQEEAETKILVIELLSPSEKKLELRHNKDTLANITLSEGKNRVVKPVEMKKGLNRFEFKTGNCDVVGRFSNNEDHRCVSVGLDKFNLETPEREFYPGSGLSDISGNLIMKGNKSSIYTHGENISLEFSINSPSEETIKLEKNGENLIKSRINNFEKKFRTPYTNQEELVRYTISRSCTGRCEDLVIHEADTSNYSKQPKDLLYKKGLNWYEEQEGEDYVWTSGNSSIYIYNYEDESKDKVLWISGRAFSEPKEIEFSLNGEKIGYENISELTYREVNDHRIDNKYGFEVELSSGENQLEIESNDECTIMGEVNNNKDIRCSLYGFKKLYLTENY